MTVVTLSSLSHAMYSTRNISTTRSYCMDVSMNSSDFDNIFFFKTTSIRDINNETTKFYVNANNWPDISFSEGIVSNNGKQDIDDYLLKENKVKILGPSWIANNITNGGSKSSDIFANANDLIKQYESLDSNETGIGIKQLIKCKLREGGNEMTPLTNLDNSKKNISKDVLSHFMNDNPLVATRLFDLMVSDNNSWIPIKFKKGDVIQFDIIYDVGFFCVESSRLEDQDYMVKITLC